MNPGDDVAVIGAGPGDPELITMAFAHGADGVMVLGCHIGDCHYISGNHKTMVRMPLLRRILEGCVEVSLGAAWQDEIDEINIRAATLLAMSRAISQLTVSPDLVLVDGRDLPPMSCPGVALVKGDARSESVAAASIAAKVARDAIMCHLHQVYPEYGFDRHKGYPTSEHLQCLAAFGPCPLHRRSYRGVEKIG